MPAEQRTFLQRHFVVCAIAGVLVAFFWFSRMTWSEEHRLWRALGDASFVLLIAALAIGPLAKLWPSCAWLLPWRREIGVWFGVLALAHTVVTMDGWIRWDIMRFFGYELVPQLGRYARLEPGFGLANAVGMVAVFLSLVLMATSSNWALTLLGPSAWKWLQYSAYTVFYLVALHAFYFLFIHFTESFHRGDAPPPNWFQYPALSVALLVPVLQAAAFLKMTSRRQIARRETEPSFNNRKTPSGAKARTNRNPRRPS